MVEKDLNLQISVKLADIKEFGNKGLMRSREKKNYSFEFKMHVVELYLTTEVSYRELALSLGINNPPIEIENKGMFNTIAQKVFGKPRFSKVHLDEMGTFIWPEIDGAKTVQELALLVKEHFGDKAEPLYPRIVKYFQIMESYEFVHFINKKTEK